MNIRLIGSTLVNKNTGSSYVDQGAEVFENTNILSEIFFTSTSRPEFTSLEVTSQIDNGKLVSNTLVANDVICILNNTDVYANLRKLSKNTLFTVVSNVDNKVILRPIYHPSNVNLTSVTNVVWRKANLVYTSNNGLTYITHYISDSDSIIDHQTRTVVYKYDESINIANDEDVTVANTTITHSLDEDSIVDRGIPFKIGSVAKKSSACDINNYVTNDDVLNDYSQYVRRDGTTPFIANQSMDGYRIIDLAPGINPTDAVNYQQLLDAIQLYVPNISTLSTIPSNSTTSVWTKVLSEYPHSIKLFMSFENSTVKYSCEMMIHIKSFNTIDWNESGIISNGIMLNITPHLFDNIFSLRVTNPSANTLNARVLKFEL